MPLLAKYFAAVLIVCATFAPRGVLASGEVTAQLSTTINEFVAIMVRTPVSELRSTGLPERARKLIFERFDFVEMTQLALGAHWKALNPGEQKEFVDAFTQRLLVNYGRTVRSNGDEKIVWQRETQKDKQASVETKVVSGGGGETPIDYQLHNVNGQWKVFDMSIDSVSLVKNFREQFQRIIARSSVQELLKKIKQTDS